MQENPFISVVVPVYNEALTIETTINRIEAERYRKEIILVDDGSDDGTTELLRNRTQSTSKDCSIQFVRHRTNLGKGAAVWTGFRHARGEFVIIQDADLEYNPSDYSKLLAPLINGEADAVYGSRFLNRKSSLSLHFLGNKMLTMLSNLCTGFCLTDMETGYKAFRSELLSRISLREDGFGFEPEITAELAGLQARVVEVPITYRRRGYRAGKKLKWKDGFAAPFFILRYNLERCFGFSRRTGSIAG